MYQVHKNVLNMLIWNKISTAETIVYYQEYGFNFRVWENIISYWNNTFLIFFDTTKHCVIVLSYSLINLFFKSFSPMLYFRSFHFLNPKGTLLHVVLKLGTKTIKDMKLKNRIKFTTKSSSQSNWKSPMTTSRKNAASHLLSIHNVRQIMS